MSFLSFKFAPAPFESPPFESLFSPAIRETLLTTRPLRHDNASSTTIGREPPGYSFIPSLNLDDNAGFVSPMGPQPHTPPLGPLLGDLQSNLARAGFIAPSSGSGISTSTFSSDCGFLNFRIHSPPPSLTLVLGSLEYDLAKERYTNRWDSWDDFSTWLKNEQEEKAIELRLSKTVYGNPAFKATFYYLCSRHGTGGIKAYQKKHPDWERKVPNKRTDCPGSLRVKSYPGSQAVLGFYDAVHNHETGKANLPYVHISAETREFIAGLLRLHVEPPHIVSDEPFLNHDSCFLYNLLIYIFSSCWFTEAFTNQTM